MAYEVKGAPFRYRGAINVEDCKTSLEVMQKANLDWNVDKCELIAKMPSRLEDESKKQGFIHNGEYYDICPNAYATYRTDYNIPLGVVKGKYTVVQNTEAFKFFDDAIGKDKAIWQTAGFFGNGERIFVSAKLPNNILVNGDPVENYLVFTTSHDGSTGVKILFTPIRVICQNTLNAAIKSADNYVSFRHTMSVHNNIDVAKELLGICNYMTDNLSLQYNIMGKTKMTDEEVQKAFANIIFTREELENINNTGHTIQQILYRNWGAISDSKISMKKVNTLGGIYDYYCTGIGQREIIGTAWGAMNAVSGFYSNVDNATGTKRMDSLLFGDKSNKIKKANDIVLA